MSQTVDGTGSGPLYQAILGDMNATGRRLATAADLAGVPMLAQVTGEWRCRLAQVNRAFQQLARAGALSIRPRAIIILDPAKLASVAERRRDPR